MNAWATEPAPALRASWLLFHVKKICSLFCFWHLWLPGESKRTQVTSRATVLRIAYEVFVKFSISAYSVATATTSEHRSGSHRISSELCFKAGDLILIVIHLLAPAAGSGACADFALTLSICHHFWHLYHRHRHHARIMWKQQTHGTVPDRRLPCVGVRMPWPSLYCISSRISAWPYSP